MCWVVIATLVQQHVMYDALMTRLNYWLNLDANRKIKILLERQEMIMKKKEDVENAEKKRVHGSFASL